MNTFTISTLNFYLSEMYTAHTMNDFNTVDLFHSKITAYACAMCDFGADLDICQALCDEASRVLVSML